MTAMTPDNWFLLMDPSWRPVSDDAAPPIESVVGLWPVESDAKLGRFRPNPAYVPSSPDAPSDPLDAVLRLMLQGRAKTDHIQLMLRDTLFDIAMNGDGRPLVTKSPDGIACVVVATGEVHRARITAPEWLRIDLEDLVSLLADDIDVLINPGGPATIRLAGDFMRETMLLDDETLAAAPTEGLRTATWSGAS